MSQLSDRPNLTAGQIGTIANMSKLPDHVGTNDTYTIV
jgi:hypothetical protein